MTECPSRFTLVQLHAGDLSESFAASLRAHLDVCATCGALLNDIQANCAVYQNEMPGHAARLSERLKSEHAPGQTPSLRIPIIAIGSALAAAAIISLAFLFQSSPGTRSQQRASNALHTVEAPTFKGTFSAQIHARRGGEVFEVTADTVLRAGDQLRFTVTAATPGYVSVIVVTEDGSVSPLYPYEDPRDVPEPLHMDAAGQSVLPGSIMLDASTGTEYLMVMFSETSFDRAGVYGRLKDQAFRSSGAHQLDDVRVQVVRTVKENE
jgi:hypothetical protein